jgi:hypothetical protein
LRAEGIDLVKERLPSGSASISAGEIQHFKGLSRPQGNSIEGVANLQPHTIESNRV